MSVALLEVAMLKWCAQLWHEAHFESKICKRATYRALLEVDKVHAAARHEHATIPHALLDVDMWKKSTSWWREAHLEVRIVKAPHVQTTFGHSDAGLRGRRRGLCTYIVKK